MTEALKQGVKCPYCQADKIDVITTTATLIYPLPHPPPSCDPNTYTTEYECRNCKNVFEEGGRIKRVRKK